ncbi:hypothetical protein [Streptomyces violascens]|uniref:hypothetical protein n=1 Tax=Streptomyces violascens TaxID=67381 RepID=UPI0016756D4C|nr:hypothetical protein [Streptomyces violascens]
MLRASQAGLTDDPPSQQPLRLKVVAEAGVQAFDGRDGMGVGGTRTRLEAVCLAECRPEMVSHSLRLRSPCLLGFAVGGTEGLVDPEFETVAVFGNRKSGVALVQDAVQLQAYAATV